MVKPLFQGSQRRHSGCQSPEKTCGRSRKCQMIEKYELISENDIRMFNSQLEKIGITAGHDLLGSPVVYVDHNLLRKSLGVKLTAKRRYITEEA